MLQSIRDGDRLIVRIDGELDHFCAQRVRRDLDALLLDRSIRSQIQDFSSLPPASGLSWGAIGCCATGAGTSRLWA